MKSFIAAIVTTIVILLSTAPRVEAQINKTIVSNFGAGAKIQCFELPEEGQSTLCWLYNDVEHHIGFFHPGGVGPIVMWPLGAGVELREMGVSDNGHFAILVTSDAVEVHTLELRRPGRLAGISTPRLKLRVETTNAVSASIAGDELWILHSNGFLEIVDMSKTLHRVFLPTISR